MCVHRVTFILQSLMDSHVHRFFKRTFCCFRFSKKPLLQKSLARSCLTDYFLSTSCRVIFLFLCLHLFMWTQRVLPLFRCSLPTAPCELGVYPSIFVSTPQKDKEQRRLHKLWQHNRGNYTTPTIYQKCKIGAFKNRSTTCQYRPPLPGAP